MPGVEPLLACRGNHDAFGGDATDALRGRIIGLCENSTLVQETAECDHYGERDFRLSGYRARKIAIRGNPLPLC
jgi:hypothetical protein